MEGREAEGGREAYRMKVRGGKGIEMGGKRRRRNRVPLLLF